MRMNPLNLLKHKMPSHLKKTVESDICLLCVHLVGSQMNKKCDYERIINEIYLDTPTLIAQGTIVFSK